MRRISSIVLILSCALSPLGEGNAAERSVAIPDPLLLDSTSRELREVMEGAAFVGEKKAVVFRGHRVVYEYLLNHLDFTSQVARVLGLSDYVIEQTGEGAYEATTPRGGWAHLLVVYADGERVVVLAQGRYGRAVVVLEYASFDRGGESYMVNNLYGYVRADNPILNFLLTLFGGILDHRVAQVFTSVAELSERAYEAPASLRQELLSHTELPPHHLLEFAKILQRLSHREAKTPSLPPT
ncbi:MAG: hypothetical protein ACE5I9_05065 [Candidatus Methylomirabilales bacterium]